MFEVLWTNEDQWEWLSFDIPQVFKDLERAETFAKGMQKEDPWRIYLVYGEDLDVLDEAY